MGYSLRLPDGSVVDDIPDNVPRDKAYETLRSSYPDAFQTRRPGGWNTAPLGLPTTVTEEAPRPKKSGVMGSLASGTESLLSSSLTGLQAVAGDAAEAAKAGIARGEQIGQKYTQEIGLQKIKDKYEGEGIGAA